MNEAAWDDKPEGAEYFEWPKFVHFAGVMGIGAHPDDYGDWWECWKTAYKAALEYKKK